MRWLFWTKLINFSGCFVLLHHNYPDKLVRYKIGNISQIYIDEIIFPVFFFVLQLVTDIDREFVPNWQFYDHVKFLIFVPLKAEELFFVVLLWSSANYEADFHFFLIRFDFHDGEERGIRITVLLLRFLPSLKIEHDSEKLSTVPFIT